MGLIDRILGKGRFKSSEKRLPPAITVEAPDDDSMGADYLPKSYGPYGLVETNPIPTGSIVDTNAYLAAIRTAGGKPVAAKRTGTRQSPEVTSSDIYEYVLWVDEPVLATIFLCPFQAKNSKRAPEGFTLKRIDDPRTARAFLTRFVGSEIPKGIRIPAGVCLHAYSISVVRVGRSWVDDRKDLEMRIDLGRLYGRPLWAIPLPPCPDCGGTLGRPGTNRVAARSGPGVYELGVNDLECAQCGSLLKLREAPQ